MSIVSQPEQLRGFPVDEKNLKGRRLEDWTIFSPEEENVVASKEPPPYTEAVYKRRRQISSSPSPPTKRVSVIPPGSPTERATTASPPNGPKHLLSTISESQRTTSSRAVSAHPRSHAEKWHPLAAGTDTNISSALENNVRSIMLDLFPAMFASFIDRPRSISPSPSFSIDANIQPTTAPSLKSIRQLRSLLTKRAAKHAERKLSTICEDMQYDANFLRQTADEEFLADVAEEKLDITQRKENALEELDVEIDRVVHEKLVELSDELDQLVEQVGVKMENAIDTRAGRYMNTTWNKALAGGLPLDREARAGNTAVRKGRAAGDRKRKFDHFRSCAR